MTRMKRIAAALTTTAALGLAAGAALAQDGAKIFVVGGKADDSFFAIIKKGVDDAALAVEQNGGSVSFLQLQTYDNIGADAGNLVRTAINQGASGIAVPNWVPGAED
jgi:simple sugar transport system substrate-binding protein